MEYAGTSEKDYSKVFNMLQPHISFFYQIAHNQKLGIECKYDVYRPDIYFLNPYVESYPASRRFGNPNLHNESDIGGAFTYQYYTQKIYSVTGGNCFYTGNSIEEYSWMDDKGVTNTTYGNVGKIDGFGFYNYTGLSAWKGSYLSINPQLSYNHFRCPILDINHYIWSLQWNVSIQQSLPYKLRLDLQATGKTRTITMMNKTSGYWDHYFVLSRNFLKNDAMTVQLIAANPFKANRKSITETFSPSFFATNNVDEHIRAFAINISLHLGKLKSSVKEANHTIINNDIKTGKSE